MIRAIHSEIGEFAIARFASPETLLEDASKLGEVKLALIHQNACDACLALHDKLVQRMPHANYAIAATSLEKEISSIQRLLTCDAVRGILPFNLKLDIWLSALRLLLSGGDYYPVEYVEAIRNTAITHGRSERPDKPGQRTRAGLTPREHDVLSLLARGHQNKIIANKLRLSEHTVKLHVHRVISKLGVHNRTEAAANYLNERSD